MPSDALKTLHEVNEFLCATLLSLRPERRHCSSLQPQELSHIVRQLALASVCLRRAPQNPSDHEELEKEFREYRCNLENLQHLLPDLQIRLLAEKSRIEHARAHLTSAAAWAESNENTL